MEGLEKKDIQEIVEAGLKETSGKWDSREDIYEGISEGDFVEYPEYNLKGTLTVRVDDHLKKEVKWIVENEPATTQR